MSGPIPPRDIGNDPDRAASETAVLAEQFRIITGGRLDLLAMLLVAGLIVLVTGRFYPPWVAPAWLGLFCLATGARFVLRNLYRRWPGPESWLPWWGIVFTASSGAAGLLWGVTALVILMTPDPIVHLFILFTLGALTVGGAVVNAAWLPGLIALLSGTILPAILILLTRRGLMSIEMGLMLAGFGVVTALRGQSINTSLIENLRARRDQAGIASRLAANEAAMEEAQSIAKLGSWEHDIGAGKVTWSRQLFEIVGLDPDATTPSREKAVSLTHPDDVAAVQRAYEAWDTAAGDGVNDHRIVMPDGAVKWVRERVRAHPGDTPDDPARLVGTLQDISARRAARDRLDRGNQVLKALIEASETGVMVVDTSGVIISCNARLSDMIGVPVSELEGGRDEIAIARVAGQVVRPPAFIDDLHSIVARPESSWRVELETLEDDLIDLRTEPLRSAAGEILGRIWFVLDVTERRRAEAAALRQARFDPLTGLANRGVFVECVDRAIIEAKRGSAGFAILFLDLDHFKDVNDTLGHPIGDELLKVVAARLRSVTRATDTLARFGGDEFAMLAAGADQPGAIAALADKLISLASEPVLIRGNTIHVGLSIGIELHGPGAHDAETLLSRADQALYRAKAEGRGQYCFFTEVMDSAVRARIAMGGELRRAMEGGELFLVYRPQVDARSLRVTGVEAMPRWRHPVHGLLKPGDFLPVAEQMGLAIDLGHWVLTQACREAEAWRAEGLGPARACVNLYGEQFKRPFDLEADVMAVLAETGLPADSLELDITETVLIGLKLGDDDILPRLRAAGVSISIDNFGVGYSSLWYLSRFPADRVKIARTFVRGLEPTPGDPALSNATIVRATIGLARELGMTVVAEGVERLAQFESLKAWGCDEMTGPYFGRVLGGEAVANLMRTGGVLPRSRA